MKKVLLTLASIVMLASCGQKAADPVKEAITAEIGKTMGVEAPKVTFATLEKSTLPPTDRSSRGG